MNIHCVCRTLRHLLMPAHVDPAPLLRRCQAPYFRISTKIKAEANDDIPPPLRLSPPKIFLFRFLLCTFACPKVLVILLRIGSLLQKVGGEGSWSHAPPDAFLFRHPFPLRYNHLVLFLFATQHNQRRSKEKKSDHVRLIRENEKYCAYNAPYRSLSSPFSGHADRNRSEFAPYVGVLMLHARFVLRVSSPTPV